MEITDLPEIPGVAAPRPFGANEAKVIPADLARQMSFWARLSSGKRFSMNIQNLHGRPRI